MELGSEDVSLLESVLTSENSSWILPVTAVSSSLQVVLDLEDVAEEKELEELEDGRCGGTTRRRRVGTRNLPRPLLPLGPSLPLPHATVTGEGRRSDLFRFSFFKTTPTDHTYRYVKGSLPRLPYCGCVPVRLHLLPERRPHHLIHINASVEYMYM